MVARTVTKMASCAKAIAKKRLFSQFSLLPYLLAILLISLPWQLRFIVPGQFTYHFGLFHEYSTFFIYLTDIIFAFTLLVWGTELSTGKRTFKIPQPIILLALASLLASSFASVAISLSATLVIYKTIKLAEFILFFFLISNEILPVSKMIFWFVIGVIFQALLGTIQFFQQGSLGLKLLGEIFLRPDLPGVAKFVANGKVVMRAYGTLPHPNVLAGFLVLALLLSLVFLLKPEKYLSALSAAIFIPVILLTFSRHAWIGLVIAIVSLLALLGRKILKLAKNTDWLLLLPALITIILTMSLILPLLPQRLDIKQFPQEEAVQGRWEGIADSLMLLRKHGGWLTGVGTGNFTLKTADLKDSELLPWEHQPVHNLLLLIWSEQGILGLISLILLGISILVEIWRKYPKDNLGLRSILTSTLIAAFVLSLFDHYFADIQQGCFLFWLVLGIAIASLNKNTIKELARPFLPPVPRLSLVQITKQPKGKAKTASKLGTKRLL